MNSRLIVSLLLIQFNFLFALNQVQGLKEEYRQGDSIRINIQYGSTQTSQVRVYVSDNSEDKGIQFQGATFNSEGMSLYSPDLAPGYHFFTLENSQNALDTLQFSLLLKSNQLFELEYPGSGAQVNEIPTIQWSGPEGVQLWKWYISDEPFNIQTDTSSFRGKILKEGWTNQPELNLRQSDTQSDALTPFVPGTKYYYAIFPAYGTQAHQIDYNRLLVNSFQYLSPQDTLDSLKIYFPNPSDTIDGRQDLIEFIRWNQISSSEYYIIRILEKQGQSNIEVYQTIQEFFANDTLFPINFNEISIGGSLQLEITAYGPQGLLARQTQELNVLQNNVIVDFPGLPSTARIQLISSQAKTPKYFEIKPHESISISSGLWDYKVNISGYQEIQNSIQLNTDTSLTLEYTPLSAGFKIRLIDENNLSISGSPVTITDLNTGASQVIYSQGSGYIQAALAPGNYSFYTQNQYGIRSASRTFSLQAGEVFNLGDQVIRQDYLMWTGHFINANKTPLSSIGFKIFDNQSNLLYRTQTDAQGKLQLNLSASNYILEVDHPNFEDKRISIQLPQERIETYTILPSIFEITGHLEKQSYITADSILKSRIPNYPIYAFSPSQDTLQLLTNNIGEFHIQSGNKENWTVGFQYNDTLIEVTNFTQETPDKNLIIQAEARIRGRVLGSDNLQGASVFADNGTQRFAGKIISESGLNYYLIEDLKEGDYQIEVQANQLLGNSTIATTIFKNISLNRYTEFSGPDITLNSSSVTRIFNFTYQDSDIEAQVNLQAPIQAQIQAGDSLQLANGFYQFSVIPNNLNILPLQTTSFSGASQPQDTLSAEFQDTHTPTSLVELIGNTYDSVYSIQLNYDTIPDSTHLFYQWGDGFWKQLSPDSLGMNSARFDLKLTKSGIRQLQYYFNVYRGNQIFSNGLIGQKYSTQFVIAKSDWILYPLLADTLRVPTKTQQNFPLKISNRQGSFQDLSTLDVGNFKISTSNSNFKIQMDSLSKNLSLTTPIGEDTTTIALKVFYKGDTLTWNKFLLTSDIIGESIQIQPYPLKQFYFPGDTVYFESYVKNKTDGQFYLLNNSYDFSHGHYLVDAVVVPDNFIGPISIQASWQQVQSQLQIEVMNSVPTSNNQKVIQRDSNFLIIIPQEANRSLNPIPIRLRSDLQDSISWGADEVNILEGAYSLYYPRLTPLDSNPVLQYTIPDSVDELYFRLFNDSSFQFIEIDSSTLSHEAFYTPLAVSKKRYETSDSILVWDMNQTYPIYFDLSDANIQRQEPYLTITPNPFSPEVLAINDGNTEHGARLDFLPSAPNGQDAVVSIQIYNMAGEKVRTLINREVFPQKQQTVYWDGFTDSQRLARNGRYLVQFISEAINQKSKKKRILKSVVVFK